MALGGVSREIAGKKREGVVSKNFGTEGE